jgi:hypothetical protein
VHWWQRSILPINPPGHAPASAWAQTALWPLWPPQPATNHPHYRPHSRPVHRLGMSRVIPITSLDPGYPHPSVTIGVIREMRNLRFTRENLRFTRENVGFTREVSLMKVMPWPRRDSSWARRSAPVTLMNIRADHDHDHGRDIIIIPVRSPQRLTAPDSEAGLFWLFRTAGSRMTISVEAPDGSPTTFDASCRYKPPTQSLQTTGMAPLPITVKPRTLTTIRPSSVITRSPSQ